jgi:hypothetical protein
MTTASDNEIVSTRVFAAPREAAPRRPGLAGGGGADAVVLVTHQRHRDEFISVPLCLWVTPLTLFPRVI